MRLRKNGPGWIAAIAILTVTLPARAETFGPGPGGSVPDNNVTGFNSDIILTDSRSIASFDAVTVTFSTAHTWVGDLVFTLTHVDTSTSVVFLNRIGVTTGNTVGDSTNFLGPYRFVTNLGSTVTGSDSIWAVATTLGTSVNLTAGTYAASTNLLGATEATSYSPTNLNVFAGQSLNGTWRLNVRDAAGGDTGVLGSWSFDATVAGGAVATPEPGGFALLLLALPVAGVIARRRKS
jgi:hypothetical protein